MQNYKIDNPGEDVEEDPVLRDFKIYLIGISAITWVVQGCSLEKEDCPDDNQPPIILN